MSSNRRKDGIKRDFNFDEWNELTFQSKRDVWNHYWSQYDPSLGKKTRAAITEQFAKTLKIEAQQIGFGCFGYGVWMLFVIVKDSKIRVPRKFSDISVNKGVVIETLPNKRVKVKLEYGGTTEFDLTNKVNVS